MHYNSLTKSLKLDLDIHTGRKVETHKRVNGGRRGLNDVNETLVGTHLELLAAVLVHVRRTNDGVEVALGGQRDGAGNLGTSLQRGVYDELGGLIHNLVVKTLQANPDLLRSQLDTSKNQG